MAGRFGETLKELRTGKNLSQQQLADKLFVNRSSIANWEAGRRIPDIVVLTRLAKIFDVSITAFTNTVDTDLAPPVVIIVDDETIILSGTIPILSEAIPEAKIMGFARVSDAVEFARNNKVDIAFLDIEIGKTSGLDLCNTLMQINPKTNVIFLTSYPEYAQNAWDTAASGFLVKPVHLNDLKQQLEKLRFPVGGGV